MTVFIDADGCPVVDITVRLSAKTGVDCIIICDTAHVIEKEGAKTITVSSGKDSVDFALVNLIQKGDVVVTQDYGLAAMCLARGSFPINQNGLVYTDRNIDILLAQRYISKKIRMSGGRFKGSAKRTQEEDRAFEKALESLLSMSI